MNSPLTTEERIWAVLSHLSAFVFGMGVLLPMIGWSEQRRKSKYASFQCLQALGYQSLGYTVWLLAYLVAFIVVLLVVIVRSFQAERSGQAFDPTTGPTMFLLYTVFFGFLALYILFPIIAVIACVQGREFHYPLLGKRLANYLGYRRTSESKWLVEEHEDRWVAAMGHFSVIIVLWGLAAPFTAWIMQGKRSLFLEFQSIQTLLYQTFVNILYFAAICFLLFGISSMAIVAGFSGSFDNTSLAGMGIFIVFSLIGSIILFVIPLFHVLGQWAGYRVLKGDNYHYPIIGKLTERWIANQTPVAGDGDLSRKAVEGEPL